MFAVLLSFAISALVAPHEEKSFLNWMRKHNRIFVGDEYNFRLGIFLSNQRRVQEHNKKSTFTLGLNHLSCLTTAEYRSLLGHIPRATPSRSQIVKIVKDDIPDSKDWREAGIVNAVKDQASCGSCWAFGTIQACESAYALVHNELLSCSEQNLVDCCTTCHGCNGGIESNALDYILNQQKGNLNLESDYPYKARDELCNYRFWKAVNQIKSYAHGQSGDEEYLKYLSSQGVCDVAIDAGSFSFQLYSGGVYYDSSCSTIHLNHAVGLVGYGTEGTSDYWIVRNSWGPSWGEAGYIRMARNANNQCGIASDALQVYA